ncbi:F-box protein SNE-like [Mangifera indica]|uniref:F-box protein SNE-like n=1 Tax=Mangifera indica TaxID=29780 RepID=UPI001CFC0518|nr:F-box protein SNE-like [Mangifera indica]
MLQKRPEFFINDHTDILIEILKRLDGRSLCVAACVCQLWCNIARNDSLWEEICFRNVSSPPPSRMRPVVVALGGYKRLYMVCLRSVLSRLAEQRRQRRAKRVVWSGDEVQLSLSLFCVDYYERLGVDDRLRDCNVSTSSLMFLCNSANF